MPTWFNNTVGTSVYNATATPTLGTASALYQAMLANQTQTTSSGLNGWMWASSNATTTTVAAGMATNSVWNRTYWVEDENVEHAQYIALAQQRVIQTQVRNAEQQLEYEAMRARQQQESLRLAQERAAALARSKELLLAHLTEEQRKSFERKKFFVVEGGKSKQLYRIRDSGSYSANVDVLEGKPGNVTHRLCCHLRDSRVPLYDHLLAQKIWIEHDEDDFVRQANRHAA